MRAAPVHGDMPPRQNSCGYGLSRPVSRILESSTARKSAMESDMKEVLTAYIKRVRDLAEHVRGNEQATKQSLIGPLFTALGYDLTDPRECVPEFRVDFGRERSVKPIDWAFHQNMKPIFF